MHILNYGLFICLLCPTVCLCRQIPCIKTVIDNMHNDETENRFARISSMAKEMIRPMPFMEITTNRKLLIDGCKGILEYRTELVKINTGRLILSVTGRGLYIKCMSANALVICGYISGIEFLR